MKHKKLWFASNLNCGSRSNKELNLFFDAWSNVVARDDIVCLLGDIAVRKVAETFMYIRGLPGNKLLLLGPNDTNKIGWYKKWGFINVIPFGKSVTYRSQYGNILLTHVPAYESVVISGGSDKYIGLGKKFAREMDDNSCVLNIHGYSLARAVERHNTVDASLEAINFQPILLEQLYDMKYRNVA